MAWLDRFRKAPAQTQALVPASPQYGWPWVSDDYVRVLGMGPAEMWRSQPYLRTVVTFLARNVAQLGLHVYQRVGEYDRQRVRDGGVAVALDRPNAETTTFELVFGLVADLALYDRAYWLLGEEEGEYLTRLPVPWVTPLGSKAIAPEAFRIYQPGSPPDRVYTVPADQVLYFHGWTPETLATGSSPVAALKEILAEQVQAARYRELVWRRGGKVGAVLSRPPEAPEWSDEARKQFKADWEAKFTGEGPNVGGTPLLEDGMRLERVDFNAHEMQFVEGARLALNTVASVYHVNPTMIGLLDNANYSNVREFRRMLYGDTLGPILAQVEDRLNAFLVPRYDDRPGIYVEFNLEEKLQGSFEEQTQALQAAVGAPWMTRNEARAVRNMPALEDAEGLVTPLNVLVGGQASPQDSAPDTVPEPSPESPPKGDPATGPGRLILLKAAITDRQTDKIADVLARFFARQRDADRYAQGGKWDEERWNAELAEDLYRVAMSVASTLGKAEAVSLGFPADAYDPDRTVEFLQAATRTRAENINRTTKDQLDEGLAEEDATGAGVAADVYGRAIESRAPNAAVGLGTFFAGFATQEAAEQIAYDHNVEPSKTWVTGSNPRPEHARLDGETVPVGEPFSNGLMWPGDAATGDAEDVAGCNCALQINLA